MGLYGNLNDVQSESIPLFILILIVNSINYLRSLILSIIQSIGFSSSRYESVEDVISDRLLSAVGTGLAGLVVISEQKVYKYRESEPSDGGHKDCVVCLCKLKRGQKVRKLACTHVFHQACLDEWLFDHYNMTCPLCRSPLVSEESFGETQRRVAGDFVTWFSMR